AGLGCVAKWVGMGLPLSGVLGRAAIMDAGHVGAVGGTYVGNPVAQAAALAVLDVIDEEGLVERSAQLGETIRARMLGWQERWDAIRNLPGLGSMLRIEPVPDPASRTPAPRLTHPIVDAALRHGFMLHTDGVYGHCIRLLAALVVSDAELDEALGAWEEARAASLG